MTGARDGNRGGAQTGSSRVVAGGIGMMGRRQVTPRWADDTVPRHVGGGVVGSGGVCPPPGRILGGVDSGMGGSIKQVHNY